MYNVQTAYKITFSILLFFFLYASIIHIYIDNNGESVEYV